MSEPWEGHPDTYILKYTELRETVGLARYLRRINPHIRHQLAEFEDIFIYKGDRFVSAGYKLKYDDLREAVKRGLKELAQSHPEFDSTDLIPCKHKRLTLVEEDEPSKKLAKLE